MADYWKPPIFSPKGRERQWLNASFSIHDTFCGCNTPALHLQHLLASDKLGLSLELQWHPTEGITAPGKTTDPPTTTDIKEENIEDLTEDVLNKLFEEEGDDDIDDLR